ncbi:MAG: hypothetical protein IAF38_19860, partial [Bacteroidia bacterium]|nr:hypothetical protein [Bacteroidia bacterium]
MKKKKIIGRTKKGISLSLALTILFQTVFPTFSHALTSGPQQEEYGSFEPAGTSDLVDLYSGDFTYNIPLLTVPGPNGGYPVNLSYHSGSTMEQEASWVGLGWTLNTGAINRGMRGLPDDYCGDNVVKETTMQKYWMVDVKIPMAGDPAYREWFGFPVAQPGLGGGWSCQLNLYYNNYKGIGYRVSPSYNVNLTSTGSVTTGVGLSFDSQNGIGIEPSLGLNLTHKVRVDRVATLASTGMGLSYNSRDGITGGNCLGFSFNTTQRMPTVGLPTISHAQPFSVKIGLSYPFAKYKNQWYGQFSGSYFETDFSTGTKYYPAFGYSYTPSSGSATDMVDFTRANVEYSKNLPCLPTSTFNSDNFSYSAQGAYGSYRPWLAGVAVLHDPLIESNTYNYTPISGIEVGLGFPNMNFGADLNYLTSFTRSGPWQNSGKDEDVNDVDFLDGSGTQLNMGAPSGGDLAFDKVAYVSNNELNRFLYST